MIIQSVRGAWALIVTFPGRGPGNSRCLAIRSKVPPSDGQTARLAACCTSLHETDITGDATDHHKWDCNSHK
jgi:hypothetical protein